MLQISNQQTASKYDDGGNGPLTIVDPRADRLDLVVANAAIVCEIKPHRDDGQEAEWTPERILYPQQASFENVSGFRARSLLPAKPAIVTAQLLLPDDPGGIGPPFTSTLAPDGSIVAGGGVITGIVNGDGSIAAGSGFAVNRTGAGVYVVTFNPSFAVAPVVVPALIGVTVSSLRLSVAPTKDGFTLQTFTAAGALTDSSWNFTATPTQ